MALDLRRAESFDVARPRQIEVAPGDKVLIRDRTGWRVDNQGGAIRPRGIPPVVPRIGGHFPQGPGVDGGSRRRRSRASYRQGRLCGLLPWPGILRGAHARQRPHPLPNARTASQACVG